MPKHEILDLSECTEFRLLVESRPPRVVHATVYLLLTLTLSALAWAHFTTADVIVHAPGRIRPIETPLKILSAARAESLSAGHANRVSDVHVREGDRVQAGQVLLRFDAARLENEIVACRARLAANRAEVNRIDELEKLVVMEFGVARTKSEAELRQAVEDIRAAEERRRAEVQIAETELSAAQRDVEVQTPLVERRVVTKAELDESKDKLKRAIANLEKAKLAINVGPRQVLEQALALAERQHQVKLQELNIKRADAETRAASLQAELTNLELEHEQSIVRSPIDGVVIVGNLTRGDSIEPNKVIFEIATTKGFRFEAQLSSEDVAHVVDAMPARIKLHAYDYQRFGVLPGVVEFVSPDSSATNEAKAPSYVVRIDVPNELPARQHTATVKLGMTGDVEIVTERRSLLSLFIGRVRQTIRLG